MNEFLSFSREHPQEFLVADYLGVVAGYIMLGVYRNRRGEIISMAVAPQYHHMGIASALINSGLRRLQSSKVKEVTLRVKCDNIGARRLYEKFGFKYAGREPDYYGRYKDAFVMRCGLN